MTEQLLNNWQHGADEIIAKTAKLYARHSHLCSLVPQQCAPDTDAEILLLLAEADRCVKAILAQMDEMENLCTRSQFFQRDQTSEARSEQT
jgi:hypothetical protein